MPGLVPGAALANGTAISAPLRALLARADWAATEPLVDAMLERLGLAPDVSLADLMALSDLALDPTLDAAAAGGWLRADPVHLRADAKLVVLLAPASGDVGADEAQALLDALRSAMPEAEWRCGRAPDRWYARFDAPCPTPRLGPAWLNGRSLTPFFPQDAAHRRWRQLVNEAQMVLHAAAANEQRSARRMTPLNAVWLWGGGTAVARREPALAAVCGRDLLLAGAARAANLPWQPALTPATLDAALAHGPLLIGCGAPFGEAGPTASAASVTDDANACAAWAWAALRAGRLDGIDLLGDGLLGRVTPAARYRFWRRQWPGHFGDPHAVAARA